MLEKIVSGGETGASQAAWRAAAGFHVATSGWMAPGFLTEDGPRPEFASQFGATQLAIDSATNCAEQNVRESDATLWFGETSFPEAQVTVAACLRYGKACLPIAPDAEFEPAHVVQWICENNVRILNVAGCRESGAPGIGDQVEQFLTQVFWRMRPVRH